MKSKGFTLIELLLVISIISVLSSASFYSLTESKKKAEDAHMQTETAQVAKAIELYKIDKDGRVPSTGLSGQMVREGDPGYNTAMGELVSEGYLSEIPSSPSGSAYAYMTDSSGNPTQAVFAASLNFVPTSGTVNNSCELVNSGPPIPIVEEPEEPPEVSLCLYYPPQITVTCESGGSNSCYTNISGSSFFECPDYPEGQTCLKTDGVIENKCTVGMREEDCDETVISSEYITCTDNAVEPAPEDTSVCDGLEDTDYCQCI